MKIAVNTRFLIKDKLEGIGIYTQEIFKRVATLLPQHEFYFLFDRTPSKEFIFSENIRPVVVSPQARHPFLWYWWFEYVAPKVLKKHKIDLFISPDGYCSLKTTIPQIITIHDIGFEHFPEHTPFLVRNYYRHFTPKYCEKATKILTVSEFSKQDIHSRYGIDSNKIEVVHNGFNLSKWEINKNTLSNNTIPYFIFVGAVHPRKNVLGLLKAFEEFKHRYNLPHQLMIVGRKSWLYDEVENFHQQMNYRNDVIWKEHVQRETLIQLMQHASALIYPSWLEGFGIPIIEAMSMGIPVVTSNVSALPEIADGAAILVNPANITEIADAMYVVITNNELRTQLIAKGKQRAQFFNWDTSAQKVADIILGFNTNL